jgi:hypothetical protein
MTEQPRNLTPSVPADAVEILAILLAKIRMDGLTGGEVAAMFQSVETLRGVVNAKDPDHG